MHHSLLHHRVHTALAGQTKQSFLSRPSLFIPENPVGYEQGDQEWGECGEELQRQEEKKQVGDQELMDPLIFESGGQLWS